MSGYGPTLDGELSIPVLSKPFRRDELVSYLNQRLAAAH